MISEPTWVLQAQQVENKLNTASELSALASKIEQLETGAQASETAAGAAATAVSSLASQVDANTAKIAEGATLADKRKDATQASIETINSTNDVKAITSNLAPSILTTSNGDYIGIVTSGVFLGNVRYTGENVEDWAIGMEEGEKFCQLLKITNEVKQ